MANILNTLLSIAIWQKNTELILELWHTDSYELGLKYLEYYLKRQDVMITRS